MGFSLVRENRSRLERDERAERKGLDAERTGEPESEVLHLSAIHHLPVAKHDAAIPPDQLVAGLHDRLVVATAIERDDALGGYRQVDAGGLLLSRRELLLERDELEPSEDHLSENQQHVDDQGALEELLQRLGPAVVGFERRPVRVLHVLPPLSLRTLNNSIIRQISQ